MRLDQQDREVVNAAIKEAHDTARRSRTIAALVVQSIRELEPSGQAWPGDYLDDLAVIGAMKVCADWRRSRNGTARTRKGTPVPVPAFAGATTPQGESVQLRFMGMTADELRTKKRRMAAQRNTMSTEIQLLDDLLRIMEADEKVATAGDALDVLRGRAA